MSQWILGKKFKTVYPHKGSLKVLWETKWKFACEKAVYPFHDGCIEDFEPIFNDLISRNINDAESDEYTTAFLPAAAALEERASHALSDGDTIDAANLLCRAAVLYRISRFPYVDVTKPDSLKRAAFERQKKVYLMAASLWTSPIREIIIPHTHASPGEVSDIPVYIRTPENWGNSQKVPVVLILTGLDGYRPDNSQRTDQILARGWACVIVEIPGTADCPADRRDPKSPDRLLDSVFAYLEMQPALDARRVVVWGLSAGGYYAIRAAHTHRQQLLGAIAHGPGSHYFLDPEWLSRVDDHEYPFRLSKAWAIKHGYANVAEFVMKAQSKFSLLETGIVDQPNCRLLLLNGTDDGVVPIEDCLVLFNHGSPKEGRFFKSLPHMGYPDSLQAAYTWLEEVLSLPLASDCA
ncbi:Alpha/Beta hydrolase protein [Aspergillus ambiguus]|uniref:heptaketide hydrolyase ayg1 n=1 Tax=Aspergillus ambiguus TaxID=176160 RepID=UPI003CCE0FE8